MNSLIERFDKLIIFVIVYTMVFIIFFKTLGYTLPFVLAFIVAYIIKRPTRYLKDKLKLKSSVSSLITTLSFFTIFVSLLTWIAVMLAQEAVTLAKNSQVYVTMYKDNFMELAHNLSAFYQNMDPSLISTIENNLSSSITNISNISVSLTGKALAFLISMAASIPYVLMVIIFTTLATYFFAKDISFAKKKLIEIIPDDKEDKFFSVVHESKIMLFNYAKSYGAIIGLTFVETLIVFVVLKVQYAFILSLLSGLFDLLPILGMGAIYVPTALIYIFIFKQYIVGIAILIAYVVIIIIRQIVEPKIVSSSLGIHPVAILAAIFIGLKANGFAGMIFCIFLVVLYTVFRKVEIL
ncbi:MAG: sporulation integral membrane protein YtvI [Clostridiaceae bacterium]